MPLDEAVTTGDNSDDHVSQHNALHAAYNVRPIVLETTLVSAASSIEVTGIPTDALQLHVTVSGRADESVWSRYDADFQFGGASAIDTGTNYHIFGRRDRYSTHTNIDVASSDVIKVDGCIPASNDTADRWGGATLTCENPDMAGVHKHGSYVGGLGKESAGSSNTDDISIARWHWFDTSNAIERVKVTIAGGTSPEFVAGASLRVFVIRGD